MNLDSVPLSLIKFKYEKLERISFHFCCKSLSMEKNKITHFCFTFENQRHGPVGINDLLKFYHT
jgi:hypothetical protein